MSPVHRLIVPRPEGPGVAAWDDATCACGGRVSDADVEPVCVASGQTLTGWSYAAYAAGGWTPAPNDSGRRHERRHC